MEQPSPKRRRTSREGSVNVPPSETQTRDDAAAEANPDRAKRPSFASPTKSSMARWNPEILERRRSSSPVKSSPSRPQRRRSPRNHGSDDAQPPAQGGSVPAIETAGKAEAARTAGEAQTSASQPAATSSTAAARLGPAGANAEEDEEFNPFLRRGIRRSPPTGINFPAPAEPELPPSVPDAVSSTPPRGIHSSSPSRWREKRRSRAKPSSPLKQSSLRPLSDEAQSETSQAPSKKRLFPTSQAIQQEKAAGRPGVLADVTNNQRNVRSHDANEKKRRKVDALKEEIRQLQADLALISSESERIRIAHFAGRDIGLADEQKTLKTVEKYLIEEDELSLQASQLEQLAKAAIRPGALVGLLRPAKDMTAKILSDEELRKGIGSHRPVEMTVEEEKPFLQVFSGFDVTSTITMLPSTTESPCLQKHALTLRSRQDPGLFMAKVNLIVNGLDLSITEMNIVGLQPAAKAEIGAFAKTICSSEGNRSIRQNIGILAWAMSEWVVVAKKRAQVWATLEKEVEEGLMSREWREPKAPEDARVSKRDILRCLGKQSLVMAAPDEEGEGHANLRFEWVIGFDWTGEAKSKVNVTVGVPGKWAKLDQKGALGRLPKLFQNLVDGGEEPMSAAWTMATLVAGEKTGPK